MKRISVVLPVLAPTRFLRAMTEFCIKAMRAHADNPFDLIVVEAEHDYFSLFTQTGAVTKLVDGDHVKMVGDLIRIDKYLNFTPKIGGVKESNAGIRAAETEFILMTGNDVIVPRHWDTELLRCFEERQDCGLAALSAFEPGAIIGPERAENLIVEGMYSPFNMFRREQAGVVWEYDEHFGRVYQDSDLVLRMYEKGLRAYRSCRAHVHHLLRMTNDSVETAKHNALLKMDEDRFYKRWGKSPLAMFGLIRASQYHFGREHVSFLSPVADGQPTHPANRYRS